LVDVCCYWFIFIRVVVVIDVVVDFVTKTDMRYYEERITTA